MCQFKYCFNVKLGRGSGGHEGKEGKSIKGLGEEVIREGMWMGMGGKG
jgi:hypothetical protein